MRQRRTTSAKGGAMSGDNDEQQFEVVWDPALDAGAGGWVRRPVPGDPGPTDGDPAGAEALTTAPPAAGPTAVGPGGAGWHPFGPPVTAYGTGDPNHPGAGPAGPYRPEAHGQPAGSGANPAEQPTSYG